MNFLPRIINRCLPEAMLRDLRTSSGLQGLMLCPGLKASMMKGIQTTNAVKNGGYSSEISTSDSCVWLRVCQVQFSSALSTSRPRCVCALEPYTWRIAGLNMVLQINVALDTYRTPIRVTLENPEHRSSDRPHQALRVSGFGV